MCNITQFNTNTKDEINPRNLGEITEQSDAHNFNITDRVDPQHRFMVIRIATINHVTEVHNDNLLNRLCSIKRNDTCEINKQNPKRKPYHVHNILQKQKYYDRNQTTKRYFGVLLIK